MPHSYSWADIILPVPHHPDVALVGTQQVLAYGNLSAKSQKAHWISNLRIVTLLFKTI